MGAGDEIARTIADDLVPRALGEVFGTEDPDAVAAAVSAFCAARLGAPVVRYVFFAGGVGTVHGVELADGRRVALKAHRGDADVAFLRAVQVTQRAVAAAGLPAPAPLLPPAPIARGIAMVETLLERGAATPAHDPAQRRRMAADLHRFVTAATPQRAAFGDHTGFLTGAGEALFPAPHDRRFDFALGGAERIDALAATARAALRAWHGPHVVGHADWRVENLRYRQVALSAIYDWDSLVVRPEPALVGGVAAGFTSDWRQIETCRIPSVEEMNAFVADYESARGAPFTAAERDLARSALIYTVAYGARCEWSDLRTDCGRRAPQPAPAAPPAAHGWRARLAELAAE